MPNNKLETLFPAINGGLEYGILTGKENLFRYENKKRTDEIIGIKLSIVLPGGRLESLTVKIEGEDPLTQITDEQIEASCSSLQLLLVKLIDCKVSVYVINGGMIKTATAKSVQIINKNK